MTYGAKTRAALLTGKINYYETLEFLRGVHRAAKNNVDVISLLGRLYMAEPFAEKFTFNRKFLDALAKALDVVDADGKLTDKSKEKIETWYVEYCLPPQ